MEKHKLWKWGLRICICLFLTFVGYKIMTSFQEDTSFDFAVKKSVENPDLNVNIFIYSHYSGSKWYKFVKRKTIVYNGIPIGKFNEKEIDYFKIFFFKDNLKKEKMTDHNIYKNADYQYYFTFDNKGFENKFKIKNFSHKVDNIIYREYESLQDNTDLKFTYYDPKKAKYEITRSRENLIDVLSRMSFEELKETDKILTKDIMQLKKLTLGQKKALIEIHNEKKFDFP